MLDFVKILKRYPKRGVIEIYPDFIITNRSKDLMIRGGDFYAVWDEREGIWSKDEQTVIDQVDDYIRESVTALEKDPENAGVLVQGLFLGSSKTGLIDTWHKYVQKQMRDRFYQLDRKITFSNSEIKKEDYISRRLPYAIGEGDISAYEEIMTTLYSPEERDKIEWAIGAIISGDSKHIQKFLVLYGPGGTGKSTVLNIIEELFPGYIAQFDSKLLGSSRNDFALESFKSNPLIAIDHECKLSRIEDNTKLNSLVSHDTIEVNAKFERKYSAKFDAFLLMGTNEPIKITDAKSGIIRRLIDAQPTGKKIPYSRYVKLTKEIKFELGAIAYHCLNKYMTMGEDYYGDYISTEMISLTDDFYSFVEYYYTDFAQNDATTLKAAWGLYLEYVDYAKIPYPMSLRQVKAELKNYYRNYDDRVKTEDNSTIRNYYSGFIKERFTYSFEGKNNKVKESWLKFNSKESILDLILENCPAQYAGLDEKPTMAWNKVTTTLKDLDTHKLHYVLGPGDHVVIDFDKKDENGNKSLELNKKAAEKWPETYAELSKSGQGIHLHYIYNGDIEDLANLAEEDVEIKVFKGKMSLRRRLSLCNDKPIKTISNLPLKNKEGVRKVYDEKAIKSEKGLRTMIERNLRKEIHDSTAPSVDFIFKILDDAYKSSISYDVTDMRPAVLAFAARSSHQSLKCIKQVNKMHFMSKDHEEGQRAEVIPDSAYPEDAPLIFVDVEVFPNLFVVVWKYAGEGKEPVIMINPKPMEVQTLIENGKLIGFNNRKYDNHILYARMMGYSLMRLYELSQRIISGSKNAMIGEAYNISYTDIYDFCSTKMSLKKWEIALKIHHKELGLPWDQPVPEELWDKVAEYCVNDVLATEAVFYANASDFKAREILTDLANILIGPGSTVNDTTNTLTTKLIVGTDKNPQREFIYPDLAKEFPGYEFCATGIDKSRYISEDVIISGKSIYKGYDPGEGGFVYAEHGMYGRSESLDSASHHPSTIIAENGFGKYTENFKRLLDLRLLIKHKEYDKVRTMFDGALAKYLQSDADAKALSKALKIAINSVYGLTAAHFENKLRDARNVDNWVAKRGALFMIELMLQVKARGYKVIHVKTDSIKIDHPDDEIRQFVYDFGKKYGYTFEVEHKFEKLCLVNNAVYVCKYAMDDEESPGTWDATGAQFAQPYVFKTLFTREPIEFEDMCETKSVTTALYLDMNEDLPEDEHNYVFVGKVGQFTPIKSGCGGGELLREKDGKYSAATGSKGYRWLESEAVKLMGKAKDIDTSYYTKLVDAAILSISEFGDFKWFVSGEGEPPKEEAELPDFMKIPEEAEEEIPFDDSYIVA